MLTMMRSFKFLRSMATTKSSTLSYYDILGVSQTASPQEIKNAFVKLTELYHPSAAAKGDTSKFQKINEAYVILSNDTSKRAYDLVHDQSKGKTFTQAPFDKPEVHKSAYVQEMEAKQNEETRKSLNIDRFGRYRGGLPRPKSGLARGGSFGETGQYHNKLEHEMTDNADYSYVDAEKAESFKDFHQPERPFRTVKWTWMKAEVDYQYFKPFKRLRPYSGIIKAALILFIVIPFWTHCLQNISVRSIEERHRKENGLPTIQEYQKTAFKV